MPAPIVPMPTTPTFVNSRPMAGSLPGAGAERAPGCVAACVTRADRVDRGTRGRFVRCGRPLTEGEPRRAQRAVDAGRRRPPGGRHGPRAPRRRAGHHQLAAPADRGRPGPRGPPGAAVPAARRGHERRGLRRCLGDLPAAACPSRPGPPERPRGAAALPARGPPPDPAAGRRGHGRGGYRAADRLTFGAVRLVIATCTVDYVGRLTAHLPRGTRLILVKADGSVSVHADDRAYKP